MAPRTALNLALALAALAALLVIALRAEPDRGISIEARDAPAGVDDLHVEVSGAVVRPVAFIASPGESVLDAIARAGGVTPEADTAPLNLTRRLHDGDRIDVPRGGERAALPDLNRASQADLEALPGIGPATARAITAARAEQPFASTDELVDRGVLTGRVYAALRDLVTVR